MAFLYEIKKLPTGCSICAIICTNIGAKCRNIYPWICRFLTFQVQWNQLDRGHFKCVDCSAFYSLSFANNSRIRTLVGYWTSFHFLTKDYLTFKWPFDFKKFWSLKTGISDYKPFNLKSYFVIQRYWN